MDNLGGRHIVRNKPAICKPENVCAGEFNARKTSLLQPAQILLHGIRISFMFVVPRAKKTPFRIFVLSGDKVSLTTPASFPFHLKFSHSLLSMSLWKLVTSALPKSVGFGSPSPLKRDRLTMSGISLEHWSENLYIIILGNNYIFLSDCSM